MQRDRFEFLTLPLQFDELSGVLHSRSFHDRPIVLYPTADPAIVADGLVLPLFRREAPVG